MNNFFDCGRYRFPLQGAQFRPLVMGILNVTPDSFSDGGQFQALDGAMSHAEQMIRDGVDIIDIGGESTRPGSTPVSLNEELDRVMPIIYALRDCGKPLSIDTYKTEVMREAILAGADMINDINGFRSDGAVNTVAESDVGLCVMHMQNSPYDMQQRPQYKDVNQEVTSFLEERLTALLQAGVESSRLCIDPGFGFGKTLAHNISMLKNIEQFQIKHGLPVLAGLSRKSMLGSITGKNVEHRLAASLAAALAAVANGAKIVRVHDVAETVDAIKVWQALSN
ncbi:dihydropteroate synthase [Undibacterium sp. Jales W-56]|uniref:dihydropteroate synthase n=1 Tax=Undibacterium sp. Jales W-56 TaxID=2897325 RepID=UPI0021D24D3C|nr:dihydropteroate synthase [Undibacterium sp. Jales W-56]MCU6435215.1 dihydropteroate synthase [Undibacterium sp. Jales W-56]